MKLYPRGINIPPESVTITLDAIGSGTSLVSNWAERVTFSGQHRPWAWDDSPDDDSKPPLADFWWPLRSTYSSINVKTQSQTTRWAKSPSWEQTAGQISNPVWLRSQIAGLIGSLAESNWLTVMSRILFQAEPDQSGAIAARASGQLVADLISSDLPRKARKLDDYLKVLLDYQLGLNPRVIFPLSLLDLTDQRNPKVLVGAEFSQEVSHLDIANRKIICKYEEGGQAKGEYVLGTDTTMEPFRVRDPANSIAEAYLECQLQRLKLLASQNKASARLPLDLTLNPGDVVQFAGNVTWKVVKSVHKLVSGSSPDTTELTLRQIPPIPDLTGILSQIRSDVEDYPPFF